MEQERERELAHTELDQAHELELGLVVVLGRGMVVELELAHAATEIQDEE